MGLALLASALTLPAQTVTFAWNASTNSSVTGYLILSGTDGINFKNSTDAGTNTIFTVTNVTDGATNYFELVAYDAYNDQSPPSGPLSLFVPNSVSTNNFQPPPPPTNGNGNGGGITLTNSTGTNGGGSLNTNGNHPITVGTTIVTNAGSGFSLLVSGNGTVSPASTLRSLVPGKKYSLTAIPAKGSVFAVWSSNGTVVATSPTLNFVAASNVMLQANFITNPFIPVMGVYHGLFYVSSNVTQQSSGSLLLTMSSAGAYSGKLMLGAQAHSISGQFSATGAATKSITIPGQNSLTVQLQLSPTNNLLTGTVSDGDWTAQLVADLAVYSRTNPAPQAGKYTLVIPPSASGSNEPAGNGFGAVTVSDLGTVTFSGTLGDGTPVATSGVVADGLWPLYLPLYGGKGAIFGWLTFTNDTSFGGQVAWFKQPEANKPYPAGFTNSPDVFGSAYHYTNGMALVSFSNGTLSLTNGGLAESIVSQLLVTRDNEATNASGDKLTFTTATGLFKGSVKNPATGKPVTVAGALLQNDNIGAGLFMGDNETGDVLLIPAQ